MDAKKLADEIEKRIFALSQEPDRSKGGILLPWKVKAEGELIAYLNDQAANIVDALRSSQYVPEPDILEKAARMCEPSMASIQLAMGELTASEKRLVNGALAWVAFHIRSLKSNPSTNAAPQVSASESTTADREPAEAAWNPVPGETWRDASRERPHPKTLVIAWSEPYGAVLANRVTSNPDFGWSCEGKVTHWMPMPTGPISNHEDKK